MLDTLLHELEAVLDELGATLKEPDGRLAKAYDAFLIRLANRLCSFGYRVKGEEFEPYDPNDPPEDWR
jgi:hypothetical protein